jgi:hypothetical protein
MFSNREGPTSPLALPDFAEPQAEREETTTAFSVATLRDLVARSATDPVVQPRLPTPSKPTFLEKSGAVLVLPESRAPSAPPVEPVASDPVSAIQPTSAIAAEPAVAPPAAVAPQAAVAPPAAVAPQAAVAPPAARAPAAVQIPVVAKALVTTHVRERRHHPRAAARPRVRTTPRTTASAFLRCRVVALGLLALVVASQPWWWNLGDLRGRGIAASSTQAARSLPSGECAGQPACNPPVH